MEIFEKSVSVACRPETAFDFLIRMENIIRITPEDAGLRLVEAPDELTLGSRVEFQVVGYGPPQKVVHEVIEFEPPFRFVELQTKGPLKSYRHEHHFEVAGNQFVSILDRIHFEPPGGMLGFLVTAERVRRSLETGFSHRHEQLKELLEAGDGELR